MWVYRIKVKVFFDCSFFNLVYGYEVRLFSYVQRESVEYIYVNEMMFEFEVLEYRWLDLSILEEFRRGVFKKLDEIQVVRKIVYDKKYVRYEFVIGDFILCLNIRRY